MKVVVVGGGIVGLSTAWALARHGTAVTVVERGPIPNPLAASTDHHRLIRSAYPNHPLYCRRMAAALSTWRAMWTDLGGGEAHYYAARGMLSLSREAGDDGDLARRVMVAEGVAHEHITDAAEIATRFPFLEPGNIASATLAEGGALMANRILADLADWLRRQGAAVLEHSPVEAIDPRGSVRLADGRMLTGDAVIVAAGTGTGRLVPELSPRLSFHRTLIVYAAPPAELAQAWANAPCWTDLGGDDDLWGMPPIDGIPAKLGCGRLRRIDAEDTDRTMQAEEVAAMLAAYRARFRGIERFTVRFHQANYWVGAPESRFVLERDDRLWAVSACSGHGFKFGALSGQDIAAAVLGDEPIDQVSARMAALTA